MWHTNEWSGILVKLMRQFHHAPNRALCERMERRQTPMPSSSRPHADDSICSSRPSIQASIPIRVPSLSKEMGEK